MGQEDGPIQQETPDSPRGQACSPGDALEPCLQWQNMNCITTPLLTPNSRMTMAVILQSVISCATHHRAYSSTGEKSLFTSQWFFSSDHFTGEIVQLGLLRQLRILHMICFMVVIKMNALEACLYLSERCWVRWITINRITYCYYCSAGKELSVQGNKPSFISQLTYHAFEINLVCILLNMTSEIRSQCQSQTPGENKDKHSSLEGSILIRVCPNI